jgi:prevent-host-death family protein
MWLDVAMKSVKIAELKDSLSEHLRAVERGAEVIVSDRNRPIARIIRFDAGGEGELTIDEPEVPFKAVRSKRFARGPSGRVSSLKLLAVERAER